MGMDEILPSGLNVWLPMPKSQHKILRHSGVWGAADEAVLNKVHKKIQKNPPC
jgi:hypothetical protein